MAAGASAYLPPRPVDDVVTGVRAHVEGAAARGTLSAPGTRAGLPGREP
jgi:hypothetical protein